MRFPRCKFLHLAASAAAFAAETEKWGKVIRDAGIKAE
jgi:hypothetical protein